MANISEIQNKYFWFINGKRLAIIEKASSTLESGEDYISPTKSGEKIRIEYVTRPIPFDSDLNKSSEIPDQFHEGLCYKVISDLYKLPGETTDINMAQYFDGQYNLTVREGKKYASRNRVTGGYIKPYDF